jgi:hypothetical protein
MMSMYGGDMKKPRASIQIKKAGDATGLEIGEEVTLSVTGTVRSIDSPREDIEYSPSGSKARMRPGCIELEIKSMRVAETGGGKDEE